MMNPTHPGKTVRMAIEEKQWTVTEASKRLGVTRSTLSRLLNGHIGISPEMAIRLERLGWSTADHWMRVQAAYDLAQARRRNVA